jgi:hypothetical protein
MPRAPNTMPYRGVARIARHNEARPLSHSLTKLPRSTCEGGAFMKHHNSIHDVHGFEAHVLSRPPLHTANI